MKKLVSLAIATLSLSLMAAPNYVDTFTTLCRGGKNSHKVYEQLLKDHSLVVIKCSMKGCGPCKRIAPKFSKMAEKYQGKARFIHLDANLYDNIISKFNIRSVPTFLIFSQGRHVKTIKGSGNINEIPQVLDKHLKVAQQATS